jgi:histidinol-phosphate aminotransferase
MMSTNINKLLRENIRKLVPYSSARSEYTGTGAVLLDANENPFNEPLNRYPDPMQTDLKQKLAAMKGVQTDQIFVGNGSDEAIDLLYRIFCEPGQDNVVSISPTYGMYQVCADINDIEVKKALLNDDFSLNSEALKQAYNKNTKLLFICTPNNPTSNSFDKDDILELASELDCILVVDEAYIDFSERKSLLSELNNYPNLVVLQTLSKAWGLAGIRLGMAFSSPEIIRLMNNVKYPYNVNRLTLDFASKALNEKQQKTDWVAMILKERKAMVKKLKMYRFVQKVYPSDANFILVKVKNSKNLYAFLVEEKIIVRDRSTTELCDGTLRITVGAPEENIKLNEALMKYQRKYVESCEI